MKKMISFTLLLISMSVLADSQGTWHFLDMDNRSSFKIKILEGPFWPSTWILDPRKSAYSGFRIRTTITNLRIYYQEPTTSGWVSVPGCHPDYYIDHDVYLVITDHIDQLNGAVKPVCNQWYDRMDAYL